MPLGFGGGMNPWRGFNFRRNCRSNAASGSGSVGRGSYFDKVKGFQGVAKAALTSATMSAAGDLLAQSLPLLMKDEKNPAPKTFEFDPVRSARMFGFGLIFYGPFQYYWYSALEWMMPVKNTANFLVKVAANQVILAPIVLSTVFAWNLGWTGAGDQIVGKIRRDLVSTMINGWKFWIPAASINFYAVPVQHQVLYMSVCGVFWTAYLSFASTHVMVEDKKAAVVEVVDKKKGKGKK